MEKYIVKILRMPQVIDKNRAFPLNNLRVDGAVKVRPGDKA